MLTEAAIQKFHSEVISKVNTPFLMFLAGQESLVCNDSARQFFKQSNVIDKDLIEYADANHLMLCDAEYWPTVAKDIISWQNTHR